MANRQRAMLTRILGLVMRRTTTPIGSVTVNLLQQWLAAIADALPHHSQGTSFTNFRALRPTIRRWQYPHPPQPRSG
jgi:hypothetical protein